MVFYSYIERSVKYHEVRHMYPDGLAFSFTALSWPAIFSKRTPCNSSQSSHIALTKKQLNLHSNESLHH